MCINPTIIPEFGPVPCRFCWQCAGGVRHDYVGRCLAEAQTATQTLVATLTYRPVPGVAFRSGDVEEAAELLAERRKDVTKYLKRLRKDYKVRYFVSGEFGRKFGRVHWHIIMFIYGKKLNVPLNCNVDDKYWKHGFVLYQRPDAGNIAYAIKYSTKAYVDARKDRSVSRSSKPPLGDAFFKSFAEKTARDFLAPQDATYFLYDSIRPVKSQRPYWLKGASLDNYMQAYCDAWRRIHGDRHMPESPFLSNWLDKQDPYERPLEEQYDARRKRKCPIAPSTGWHVGYDAGYQQFFQYQPDTDKLCWLQTRKSSESHHHWWGAVLPRDSVSTGELALQLVNKNRLIEVPGFVVPPEVEQLVQALRERRREFLGLSARRSQQLLFSRSGADPPTSPN